MAITKAEEIAMVAELAERLGPGSYLGPWLADCLPMLADCIASDLIPEGPVKMRNDAAMERIKAMDEARKLREQGRAELDRCREEAAKHSRAVIAEAEAETERIKGKIWQALRLAMRNLES